MKKLRGSMPEGGGSLVLLWSGHAVRSPADGLRLLARDSGDLVTTAWGRAATWPRRAPSRVPASCC